MRRVSYIRILSSSLRSHDEPNALCFIITETRETFKLYPGEVMYIPENCEYQMMNYEEEAAEAVFAISEL